MRAKIQIGDYYSGMDLEDWIKQVDSRLEWLTSNLIEVEKTIERIKQIVPLVDDGLGMHLTNDLVESSVEGHSTNGN